ncbi:MAG: hypothetical protein MR039_00370 [Elusimicrobia bacterium]|nr:hypothetical protein [Elusimicrobiota bacterium]
MKKTICTVALLGLSLSLAHAQQVAPQTPALELNQEPAAAAKPVPAEKAAPAPKAPAKKRTVRNRRRTKAAAPATNLEGKTAPGVKETLAAQADVSVEAVAAPVPQAVPAAETPAQVDATQFEVKREEVAAPQTEPAPKTKKTQRVVYNPKNHRDPTLSPDDFLLLQYREQQRLAAIEAERQRQLAEERRKREEAERLRQLELARIKDPTREVRNKIHVGGIIGQEVFIGSRIYTVGKSIYGARIVEVRPDEVVFSYKGHKFVRKVQLPKN